MTRRLKVCAMSEITIWACLAIGAGLLLTSLVLGDSISSHPTVIADVSPQGSAVSGSRLAPSTANDPLNQLDTKTQLLEQRLNLESQSTDQQFKVLAWVGGIVTLFVTFTTLIFGVWGFFRERQRHDDYKAEQLERRRDYLAERESYERRIAGIEEVRRKDYERERGFYEERALAFASLQEKATTNAIDIAGRTDARQQEIAAQQLDSGKKFLLHTDEMLNEQLANVVKLRDVIDLVSKVFTFQLQKEEKQQEVLTSLTALQQDFKALTTGYAQQYEEASNATMKLAGVRAMNWSRLSPEDLITAARARVIYDNLFAAVKKQAEDKSPFQHAHMLQLMGTTAYYSNDIDSAFRFWRQSDDTYERHRNEAGYSDNTKAHAYTRHFLGVAAKSWQSKGSTFLEEAKRHLDNAYQKFERDSSQFLTPVTLAEVYSYVEADQTKAQEMLAILTQRLERLEQAKKMDDNQSALLVHSYLILGNLATTNNDISSAKSFYARAKDRDIQNPFAELSLLRANDQATVDDWKRGLELLERSRALAKTETTTKMTVLVWACVAAFKAGETQKYQEFQREFEAMGKSLREESDRIPYAFSPLSKKLVVFKELQAELQEFLQENKVVVQVSPQYVTRPNEITRK